MIFPLIPVGDLRVCPRNADAHALCARVAELEKQLAEADFCIAWQADPSDGTDPRYMGRKANLRGMKAQDAAIAREEQRKQGKEAPHEPNL
jgi:hypothetical protein